MQAAIAAVHDEAAHVDATDWPQILALYGVLMKMSDNPIVALNHAVAMAMVRGPRAGLDLLAALDHDDRLAGHYRLDAVRAHLGNSVRIHDRDAFEAALADLAGKKVAVDPDRAVEGARPSPGEPDATPPTGTPRRTRS